MQTPISDLSKLGKYGIVGVLLALVGAVVFSLWLNYSLATNYISDSSKINMKLTNAVTELSTIIKLPNLITKKNQ